LGGLPIPALYGRERRGKVEKEDSVMGKPKRLES
jgi:hypothetical protein